MNCPGCNAGDSKIRVVQSSRNWICIDCNCEFDYNQAFGTYHILRGGVQSAPSTPLVTATVSVTPMEFNRAAWDRVKQAADGWPEIDKMMTYYYLNKSGYSMHGLDARIETELGKKYKEAK